MRREEYCQKILIGEGFAFLYLDISAQTAGTVGNSNPKRADNFHQRLETE